jgi:hypothetical protein
MTLPLDMGCHDVAPHEIAAHEFTSMSRRLIPSVGFCRYWPPLEGARAPATFPFWSYCLPNNLRATASASWIASPETSYVTFFTVPVKGNESR